MLEFLHQGFIGRHFILVVGIKEHFFARLEQQAEQDLQAARMEAQRFTDPHQELRSVVDPGRGQMDAEPLGKQGGALLQRVHFIDDDLGLILLEPDFATDHDGLVLGKHRLVFPIGIGIHHRLHTAVQVFQPQHGHGLFLLGHPGDQG